MLMLRPSRAARNYAREQWALWGDRAPRLDLSPPRRQKLLSEEQRRIEAGERRIWTAERSREVWQCSPCPVSPTRRLSYPAAAAAHVAGTAVHFAGVGANRCQISNLAFTLGDFAGFTIAAWVKIDTGTAFTCDLIVHGETGTGGWLVQCTSTPAFRLIGVNNGGAQTTLTSAATTLDAWHLLVAGWDGQANTNSLFLSVDGGAYTSTALTAAYVSNLLETFVVGAGVNGVGPAIAAYQSIGYWHSRLLSSTEVTTLWNAGAGIQFSGVSGSLLTNLVAWYDCHDTAGQNMVDASGAGLTLLGQNGTSTYTSVAGHV